MQHITGNVKILEDFGQYIGQLCQKSAFEIYGKSWQMQDQLEIVLDGEQITII